MNRHGGAAAARFGAHAMIIAVVAAAGCAHDLPGWKVASTEHFRVYTDQPPRVFESVLERLEGVHAGLSSSLFSVKIPATEVFIFEPSEFQALLGPVGGRALGDVGKAGVLVLFDGYDPQFIEQTAAHELAHAFIGATFRSPPVWFNEGFATYAESIMIQEDAVLFGSRKVGVADEAAAIRLVKVADLFAAPARQFHGDWEIRHYTTAWAVIHYLWHGEDKRLRRRFDVFGAALSAQAGRPGGSARAWQAVFPDVPLATLDDRLVDHMHHTFDQGKNAVVGFRWKRPPLGPISLQPADMRYVDQVRAQLRTHRRADRF
jgi:hypothetical protein